MVFVLDKNKKPLMPCSEKRARLLLDCGRAKVSGKAPFTICLKDRTVEESELQPLRLKIDPGCKTTGLAVLTDGNPQQAQTVVLGELHHKSGIKQRMDKRSASRRGRRCRNTRYRVKRFKNRHPAKCACCGKNAKHNSRYCQPCHETRNFMDNGYREYVLPPSIKARINQTMNVVNNIRSIMPIGAISSEHVKFDTQLLQNADIEGVEYQQGTLAGYEVKEYLLEKFGRQCAYCGGLSKDSVLEIEHMVPRNPKHGPSGTNRISNLTIACSTCNSEKGNLQPEEWLAELVKSKKKIDEERVKRLPKAMEQLKKPLKDAAIMDASRWELYRRLQAQGLPIERGSGALTKMQRINHDLPKTHYYDACNVGLSTPETLLVTQPDICTWVALGRGNRQMAGVNKYGFPIRHRENKKSHFGFQTGDLVVADIPKGKYKGVWRGTIMTRATGYFDIRNSSGKRICEGVSHNYMKIVGRASGWHYELRKDGRIPPHR